MIIIDDRERIVGDDGDKRQRSAIKDMQKGKKKGIKDRKRKYTFPRSSRSDNHQL